MTSTLKRLLASAAGLAVLAAAPALAQAPPAAWPADPPARAQPAPPPAIGQPQPQPKAKQPAGQGTAAKQPPAAGKAAAPKEDAAPARAGDAQLRQRIEQLEEQLADMQVLIGTLESLGRGGGATSASDTFRGPAAPAAGGGGGVDTARIDSLETQIRAISDQIEQLAGQVRQLGRRSSGESVPSPAPSTSTAAAPPAPAPEPPPSRVGGFGSVTVTPGGERERDPIGRLITAAPPAGPPPPASPAAATPAAAPAAAVPSAPLPPAAAGAASSKELYETAYGYLLQQDYGSAEVSFEEFLRRYPNDRLTADAQYWLGESLYVQRRYKPAGQAFLRVIEKHASSNKVPHSILKLAQSLDQLGQKDCALFEELNTRHPNAPADVKSRARALKQRVGC